jgi:hypothetical protein
MEDPQEIVTPAFAPANTPVASRFESEQSKRSGFGIMPGQMEEKVSDTIELTLSIAGASPR